jgi:hypothetical protein
MKNSVLFTLLLFVAACKHKDEGLLAPVVTITAPQEGQEFVSGTDVAIKGTASDDAGLHEGTVVVLKSDDNKELFRKEPGVHDLSSFAIDYSFKPVFATPTNLKVVATFYDHDDNKTEKVVNFKVKP